MDSEFIASTQELEHKIVIMHVEGWSIRSLCRHFHLGRNRVRRIIRAHCRRRDSGAEATAPFKGVARTSKLDSFTDHIKRLLENYPDITAVRLREELLSYGYDGGITILRDRLRLLRPLPKREPVVRFETEPGAQGQMDWSPFTIDFSRSGKSTVLCFSYILGFSRRQYIDFVQRRDFYTLIRCHATTFDYFGGVPRHCLYDNEKTVVLRYEAGQPLFNPAFIDFITHYRCKPIACRPGRPQTKGKVERPFQYVEGNLLNGRTLIDPDDLRSLARWWMAEKSDTHIHDTTGRSPLELFLAEEKSRLLPLPAHPYDCGQVVLRVCSLDGFLEFETNQYSVPYEYVGDILALKATEREIFIYSPHLELIATHERRRAGEGAVCEDPSHRTAKKIRYGLEPVRESFERIGEDAKTFLDGLRCKQPRHCGFHARRILMLKELYSTDDINNACRRACRYHAYDAATIERILRATARRRTLESIRNEKARSELEKTLPPIHQRTLDEYTPLLRKDNGNEDQRRSDSGQDTQPPQNPPTPENGEGTGQGALPGD